MNDALHTAFTRRQFMIGGLTLASASIALPQFLSATALGLPSAQPGASSIPGVNEDRILVVIQLSGGNDGLNTVVPYEDAAYYKARPGIGLALKHASVKPEKAISVFAGADVEATARVRELLAMYPPSSPSVAIFRDGHPVYMMHRYQIENSTAPQIAETLVKAFEQYCVPQVQNS